MACYHPNGRYTERIDCGAYIAVMIYCAVCGALITQINEYKDEKDSSSSYNRPAWNELEE